MALSRCMRHDYATDCRVAIRRRLFVGARDTIEINGARHLKSGMPRHSPFDANAAR
jgi:hypothetical protein